jgi:hypothetical protein
MQRFHCPCGNSLFFESSRCLRCQKPVAYDPEGERFVTLPAPGKGKLCANGALPGVCNWLVPSGSGKTLCLSCEYNQRIPDLNDSRNVLLWSRVESAKRRLIYELRRLRIPPPSKTEDALGGLAFEIVSTRLDWAITTGHLNGVVTINLEEADDTYRQINRQNLGEGSRTLLGHFRHESGHYFWQLWFQRLVWNDPHRFAFRDVFGDERTDYSRALDRHYFQGPGALAPSGYITGYAASHPWEDWAETWAHYLQLMDGVETFEGLGLESERVTLPAVQFSAEDAALPPVLAQDPAGDAAFLVVLGKWLQVAAALNEMAASTGQPMMYPYVVTPGVVGKLRLIHYYVQLWALRQEPVNGEPA